MSIGCRRRRRRLPGELGAGQIAELYGVLVPLLARAADLGAYRPVQPVIVEIENGEHSGTPDKDPGSGRSWPSRCASPGGVGILTGSGQSKEALDGLRTAAGRDKVTVLHFAMYAHPGRRLPLGWALSQPILEDIDAVDNLGLNQQAAADLRLDDGPVAT